MEYGYEEDRKRLCQLSEELLMTTVLSRSPVIAEMNPGKSEHLEA